MTANPPGSRGVLAIAHRGEPRRHRENTLSAIDAAFRAGAPMVEIDVRLTADGAPVLLHDADLARLWNRPDPLGSLTRKELRTLVDSSGERIPDLAEAVELAVRWDGELMVDLPEPQAGPVAFDVLCRTGELDRMLFAGRCEPLRAHAPAARIALSWESLDPPTEELLEWLRPEYFNPYFLLLTPDVVQRMRDRGTRISVWTVDDADAMRAVVDAGADAVISNEIALLLDVLGTPGAVADTATGTPA